MRIILSDLGPSNWIGIVYSILICYRRLWKDVTYNLKINDIDAATVAKSGLEHRQRTEAAERKEKNVKWETKLFQPIGENWQFMNPLEKRLMEEGAKK